MERQIILHSLLELECIPVGMELFPAANEAQWEFIKRTIAECDYYVLIVAGKYGSLGPDGISYTEMEYRYALECGKPMVAFLHSDPTSLPKGRREPSSDTATKLAAFRALCQRRLCKMWKSADSLAAMVTSSMVRLMKDQPTPGWVSGKELELLAAKHDSVQQCLRRVSQINQLPFSYHDRRIVHKIHSDGSGTVEEEFTLSPSGDPVVLYRTRYGFHTRANQPCCPQVEAWDATDGSPLSVAELSRSEVSVLFVILLDQPSTVLNPNDSVCVAPGITFGTAFWRSIK